MSTPSQAQPPTQQAIARHFIDASPEEVFSGWVTPHLIEQWWGPDGFTTIVRDLDAREDGRFVFEMTAPNGASCLMTGFYRRIRRPSLLVIEIVDHCNINLPAGIAAQQHPSTVTVELLPRGSQTELVLTHDPLWPTYATLATASWSSVLHRLAGLLDD